MSTSKRLSQSLTGSWKDASTYFSPPTYVPSADEDIEEWLATWRTVFARDLIDSRIVPIDAETSVEEACELLLAEDIPCLVVRDRQSVPNVGLPYHGLFDFADVNAFLTLAATRHTLLPEDLRENPRINDIVTAAKAGRVPVHLVSNLSQKNPIEILPNNATILSLLEVFSRGAHRTLIRSSMNPDEFVGMVSDRRLLSWFDSYARETPSFQKYLSNPLQSLSLPSLNLNAAIVASKSSATILDAMKLMSEQGVSSIAITEEQRGILLSAVSVTDIGKSNQVLATPLHHFIAQIKEIDGSTDGADRYPVYSVFPSSVLSYTIEKLLATNAHRLFVTRESGLASPTLSPSSQGNLTGIVSIVDILSLFARVAKIENIDPTQMQRHRRASSASSSISDRDLFNRSRSNSRTSIRKSPAVLASSPPNSNSGISVLDLLDSSRSPVNVPVLDSLALQRKSSRRSIPVPVKKESIG
uniref:CBS domain-containing protein n=1 Tax=Psilocybe cubensis TaxID=181762 RepID=A0A8H7XYD2_PSICU